MNHRLLALFRNSLFVHLFQHSPFRHCFALALAFKGYSPPLVELSTAQVQCLLPPLLTAAQPEDPTPRGPSRVQVRPQRALRARDREDREEPLHVRGERGTARSC